MSSPASPSVDRLKQRPPNIVLIMADQLGAKYVGCYGQIGVPVSPTIDRLSAEGVQFKRCYATHPICAPNRATMLTGRSCISHGIVTNNFVLTPSTPTYAHVLGKAGYRVGGFGKFHVTPMPLPHPPDLRYLGFDQVAITEDPKWGAYISWIETEHPEHFETALAMAWGDPRGPLPAHPDPRYRQPRLAQIRERVLGPRRRASAWAECYPSPLPKELHQTTWITDRALGFMKESVATSPERPFFCKISYVDPHDPYDPPDPYARMFDPAEMPSPIPAAWRRSGNTLLEAERQVAGFAKISRDQTALREVRAKYAGSIRFIDDQIERVVQHLRDSGLWDNTIVLFTADHGDCMGDHELFAKGVIPYDASIHVPLVIAGGPVALARIDRLICTLDFFPTFCDWAGISPAERPPLEGKSFAAETMGQRATDTWSAVSVSYDRMATVIRDDGWRLTVFDDPNSPNELVDLRADPAEQSNCYEDPAHWELCRQLFESLVHLRLNESCLTQYRNLPLVDGYKMTPPAMHEGTLTNPLPFYACGTPWADDPVSFSARSCASSPRSGA